MREDEVSLAYLKEIEQGAQLVSDMWHEGLSLPRCVWRARTLYKQAWRREILRYRGANENSIG